MKRFHVHVGVNDLQASIRFYSTLFGHAPSVEKPDYAKWMLDDPRVNFAISTHGKQAGLDHLGIQVETADELDDLRSRLQGAQMPITSQSATTCCYARSDKHWTVDPQNIAWEGFQTLDSAPRFMDEDIDTASTGAACCTPLPSQAQSSAACCKPTAGSSCCA